MLVARAFRLKLADEIAIARDCESKSGDFRKALRPLADVSATKRGFALKAPPRTRGGRAGAGPSKRSMRRCLPSSPTGNRGQARLSRSALGTSQRTVQRAVESLAEAVRCSRSVAGARAVG